jgi:hypothetical protein
MFLGNPQTAPKGHGCQEILPHLFHGHTASSAWSYAVFAPDFGIHLAKRTDSACVQVGESFANAGDGLVPIAKRPHGLNQYIVFRTVSAGSQLFANQLVEDGRKRI